LQLRRHFRFFDHDLDALRNETRRLSDETGPHDTIAGRVSGWGRAAAMLAALALLALATLTAMECYYSVEDFRTSAGMIGTPGQFTARTCQTVPDDSGPGGDLYASGTTYCEGTFVSADGTLTDPNAEWGGMVPGATIQLRHGPNGFYQTGLSNTAPLLGLVLFSAGLTLFLAYRSLRVALQFALPSRRSARVLEAVNTLITLLIILVAILAILALLVFGVAAIID
jgi:amino acid transporter